MNIKDISPDLLKAAMTIMQESKAKEIQEKTDARKVETLGNKVKAANAMKKNLNTKMQGTKFEKLTQRARSASLKKSEVEKKMKKEEVEVDEAIGRDNENRKGWIEYSKKTNHKFSSDTTPETKRANRASKKLSTTTDPKEKSALRLRRKAAWNQADTAKNNASIYNNAKKLKKEEVEIGEGATKMTVDLKNRVKKQLELRKGKPAAKKAVKEDTQIDEISHRAASEYRQAANADRKLATKEHDFDRMKKRLRGITKATAKMDGYAKVNTTGQMKYRYEEVTYQVEHAEYGIGVTIPGQLYDDMTADVMFEDGIVLGVPMDELEVIE
jgi:hypothetical protein